MTLYTLLSAARSNSTRKMQFLTPLLLPFLEQLIWVRGAGPLAEGKPYVRGRVGLG